MTREIFLIQAGVYALLTIALVAVSVVRGRTLWHEVARRYPDEYETMGRPMAGFFNTRRRAQHYDAVRQRAYTRFEDWRLVERFDRFRRSQLVTFAVLFTGLVYLGVVALLYKDAWSS